MKFNKLVELIIPLIHILMASLLDSCWLGKKLLVYLSDANYVES